MQGQETVIPPHEAAKPAPDEPEGEELGSPWLGGWVDRLWPFLAFALFAGALAILHRELAAYSYRDLVRAARAVPLERLGWAVALTALAYAVLPGYDAMALRYIRFRLPFRRTAFGSFIAYAFSQLLGFPLLTGGSVRYRLWSAWGLSSAQIARAVSFVAFSFTLGMVAVSGVVLVRLEPIAFIMLTFALADLFEFAANHAHKLTGGDSGTIASLPDSLNVIVGVDRVYYVILAIAVVVLAIAFVFVKADTGLMLRGIREDALRARTLGISVDRRRLGVFALAGGVAAAAGGLSVLSAQIVYPSVFAWQVSANALIVTLLGGVGLFSGPVLGAVLLGLINFYVGRLTTNTLLIDGVVLLAVVLMAPRGVGAAGRGGLLGAPVALMRRARAHARDARAGVAG